MAAGGLTSGRRAGTPRGQARAGRVVAVARVLRAREAQATLPEVAALLQKSPDADARAALADLAGMLEACAATPGSYLRFMGD
ncbi:hypothetical protein GCM10017786_39130 [Amycolatopsis deserti]|uniref:Uncharacterized protein n=1 Tax=Amycolatopsis deserti TaxID=185696 RepID=A0ABQ3J2K4_9PSEU|nr:hypothetical protein [Amycolatopsis deserti]GHF02105.1 hypothetical protein GCM10017786_39130 [Amycolatopsis deserti]